MIKPPTEALAAATKYSESNKAHVNVFILHVERMWALCIRLHYNRGDQWNKFEFRSMYIRERVKGKRLEKKQRTF